MLSKIFFLTLTIFVATAVAATNIFNVDDPTAVMKDGRVWKTVTFNPIFNSTTTNPGYDSVLAFDRNYDSLLNHRCGEGYHPATLDDYYNTQYEYLEHIYIIYQARLRIGSGLAGGTVYTLPQRRDDSVVTITQYGALHAHTVIVASELLRDPTNIDFVVLTPDYDTIQHIFFNHAKVTLPRVWAITTNAGTSTNVACISNTKVNGARIDSIVQVIHDTVYKNIDIVKTDTLTKIDTVIKNVVRIVHDTTILSDTKIDTMRLVQHDTTTQVKIDTIKVPAIKVFDTIKTLTHDTVNTCKDGVFSRYYERLFQAIGVAVPGTPITVSADAGSGPSIEVETDTDIAVEVYVYDNIGIAVTSGTYTIKASTSKQYIRFNGYANTGARVLDGIYLMRVVSNHNKTTSNNVYRIGITNHSQI